MPIGGLTPYPKHYKRDRATNVDVTLSPLALSTLVNISSSSDVAAAYKEAVKGAEVKLAGNAMTAGALSQPSLLLFLVGGFEGGFCPP